MAKTFLYDVFLSHNRTQKEWTRELARRLRQDRLRVWFDEWELPKHVGRNWIDLLVEGVEQSRKAVLIWSPEFFANDWPEFESSVAQQIDPVGRKERILPILHTRCEIHKKWGFREALDFTGCGYGTIQFEFRYHQLLYNLDNSRPFEGDFEIFKIKWQAQKPERDEIPPPGPLPKGSRMPHAPSKLFVGREKELRELAQSLTPGGGTTVGVHAAVTGMGGVGKTQLAIEYAHRYGSRYPGGVFWLNMESADNAINEMAACGERMGLPGFSDLNTPDRAALVRREWEEDQDAQLLIFDNAEDALVVKSWRPVTGPCSLLITSRRQDWPLELGVQALPVETLPRQNSIEMLQKARPNMAQDAEEHKAADNLCDLLGDLPLALKVAGAYLQRYRLESIRAYLEDLRQALESHPEMKQPLWSCFAASYRKIAAGSQEARSQKSEGAAESEDGTDSLALRLFHLAAYFAPVSISPRLLAQAAGLDLDQGKREDERSFNTAVGRLQELSLISQEPDARLLLHRLLRQFARSQQPPGIEQELLALKVWQCLNDFAGKEIGTGLPQELTRERAHLREAATEAEPCNPKLAAALYNWLGLHGRMLALPEEARPDLERALRIGEGAYGPNDPHLAVYANDIGAILHDHGDLAGALGYMQRALKIDEEVYGLDHPTIAVRINNIGMILWSQGDPSGALGYVQRALKIDEQMCGANHPTVAIRANNIGQILMAQGDLWGALEYVQRALKIDEQVYGVNHPSVARDVNNIGGILRTQGDLLGALEQFRRALKIDERVYGPNHPDVARDVNNIGGVLQTQGDLPAAEKHIRRAFEIFQRVYGPEHASTKTVTENLRLLQEEIERQAAKGAGKK